MFGEALIGVSLFNHPFSLGLLKYLRYGDNY
nr:MAG TPA: Cyclo(L-leucyl-L-leucyl) synthase [Bacteriophage sp.]